MGRRLAAIGVAVVVLLAACDSSSPTPEGAAPAPAREVTCPTLVPEAPERPYRPILPAAPEGFDGNSQLIPDGHPDKVVACWYDETSPEDHGHNQPWTGTATVEIPDSVWTEIRKLPRLTDDQAANFFCLGIEDKNQRRTILVFAQFGSAAVWIGTATNACVLSTNGAFVTAGPQAAALIDAYLPKRAGTGK